MNFSNISHYLSPNNWRLDTLSGITVALALIPEAIAFAFVAGVDPLMGLYAAFIVSLVAALLSGRPGMISGATGALAVVMVHLVHEGNMMGEPGEMLGVQYLLATVVLMGIIQLGVGFFKLGKFSRLIPYPVMLGFVNGLAIVIGLSQLNQFKNEDGQWLIGSDLFLMIGLVILTMAIMYFLPKLTKAVPSALVAIIVVALLVIIFKIDTPTVNSMLQGGSLAAGFPQFALPGVDFFSLETLAFIFPYALVLAFIGLVESLMTLSLIDEMTDTRGKNNRECMAQGTANIVTGFFGGMGGCAMVGQSMINIKSGGRGRLAGIVAGIGLLLCILFFSDLIGQIPLAALVGVMFMVVIGTFAWSSFRMIPKIPISDAFVLILVSLLTVIFDLAIAVIAGIIISALVFTWKKSTSLWMSHYTDENGAKHYKLEGYVFFASIEKFRDLFTPKDDPDEVYIDFKKSKVLDHSGIEALNALTEKYRQAGKKITLQHLSKDCYWLLKNAEQIIEVNIDEDPHYRVAASKEG